MKELNTILKQIKSGNTDFKLIYKNLRDLRTVNKLINKYIFNFKQHVKILEYLRNYEPDNIEEFKKQVTKLKEIKKLLTNLHKFQ